MHERYRICEIPTGISQEGEEEFFLLFGISFYSAQELATWEGEIGDRFRLLFKYLKGGSYGYTNKQESESSRKTQ